MQNKIKQNFKRSKERCLTMGPHLQESEGCNSNKRCPLSGLKVALIVFNNRLKTINQECHLQ